MSRFTTRLRRGAFGLSVLGALGFGATQALAAPQPPASGPLCVPRDCLLTCVQRGAAGGICDPNSVCVCFYAP